jgi:hypothetical protein
MSFPIGKLICFERQLRVQLVGLAGTATTSLKCTPILRVLDAASVILPGELAYGCECDQLSKPCDTEI